MNKLRNVRALRLSASEVCLISANAWDAFSAKSDGFQVLRCDRFRQLSENIPTPPDREIATLSEIVDFLE